MNIDFPFHIDQRGQTATTNRADHVNDMIRQYLFTIPGERVNRPDFGAGLLRDIFEPMDQETAAVIEHTVRSGLEQWLGELIDVESLQVIAQDSKLYVELVYRIRQSDSSRTAVFEN